MLQKQNLIVRHEVNGVETFKLNLFLFFFYFIFLFFLSVLPLSGPQIVGVQQEYKVGDKGT